MRDDWAKQWIDDEPNPHDTRRLQENIAWGFGKELFRQARDSADNQPGKRFRGLLEEEGFRFPDARPEPAKRRRPGMLRANAQIDPDDRIDPPWSEPRPLLPLPGGALLPSDHYLFGEPRELRDPDHERDPACWVLYLLDIQECNRLHPDKSPIRVECYASAARRYAACLKDEPDVPPLHRGLN